MDRKRFAVAALLAAVLTGTLAPAVSAHESDPVQRQLDLLIEEDGWSLAR